MVKRAKVKKSNGSSAIAFVSSFPPRPCGLATFTADLTSAIDKWYAPRLLTKVVAMNVEETDFYYYPKKVLAKINQSRADEYRAAAELLNRRSDVKAVNIQHEFGIFGGPDGEMILTFLDALTKPAVLTWHTVIPAPNARLRDLVQALSNKAAGLIVMTKTSKEILEKIYNLPGSKIAVVPHGIHPALYQASDQAKLGLGLKGKMILTNFGLMSRAKGIEYVLEALPAVVAKFPNILYCILGVTHPQVLRQEGEVYRRELVAKIHSLNLQNHVRFYNTYFRLPDLLRFLQATDIYVASSLNPHQAVSGTLSYALGAGRPVISTSFAQAKEYITPNVGRLVGFKDPAGFSRALIELLSDPNLLSELSKGAYARTRHMTWPNIALLTVRALANWAPDLAAHGRALPPVKISHLQRLTDDFGIIQFARFTRPDKASGYTVDDNARALVVALLHYQRFKQASSLKLVGIYLRFLEYAWRDNFFQNYVNIDRTFNVERNSTEGSGDANGRAIYALARLATTSGLPRPYRRRAQALAEQAIAKQHSFTSARSASFFINGLACFLRRWANPKYLRYLRRQGRFLLKLYKTNSRRDWQWFEPELTYANGVICEAMFNIYRVTGRKIYYQVGKKTLDFLLSHTLREHYAPIGQNGWYRQGQSRQYFDQQPEDAAATLAALQAMRTITKQERFRDAMYKVYNWFLGDNITGQMMYDPHTGGCFDGLKENSVNLNHGAESTLAHLAARLLLP